MENAQQNKNKYEILKEKIMKARNREQFDSIRRRNYECFPATLEESIIKELGCNKSFSVRKSDVNGYQQDVFVKRDPCVEDKNEKTFSFSFRIAVETVYEDCPFYSRDIEVRYRPHSNNTKGYRIMDLSVSKENISVGSDGLQSDVAAVKAASFIIEKVIKEVDSLFGDIENEL